MEKKSYKPGEAGRIDFTVRLGGQTGLLEKAIFVETNENPKEPEVLRIRLFLPEVAHMSPDKLEWRVGVKAQEKIVEIKAMPDEVLNVLSAHCEHPTIHTAIKAIKKGEDYQVLVRPYDTGGSLSSEVIVTVEVHSEGISAKKELHILVKVDYDL